MTKVELRQITDQLTELVGGGDNRRVAALIDDDTMDIVGWCFVKVAEDGSTSVVSETYKNVLEMVVKEGSWVKKDKIVEEACKWLEENITNDPTRGLMTKYGRCVTRGELLRDFKQAMMEE